MAKTLNTRIRLKYDSFTNWNNNGGTKTSAPYDGFIPLAGEVCICTAGTISPDTDEVLFKVGDGVKNWKSLPWVSAKAADVPTWAKLTWEEFAAKFTGGSKISVTESNGTITISHEETTKTSTTSSVSVNHGGNFSVIDTVESDAFGHVTKVNTKTVTLPDIDDIDHTVVAAGTLIDVDSSLVGTTTTYTVSHENINSGNLERVVPVDEEANVLAHDGTFTAITSIEKTDAVGHIVQLGATTFKLPSDAEYDLSTSSNDTKGVLNLKKDNTVDSTINITGNGTVTVASDASGNINVDGTSFRIATTADSNKAVINLNSDYDYANKPEEVDAYESNITIEGTDAVKVTSVNGNKVTVTAHDTKYDITTAQNGSNVELFLNDDLDNTTSDKVTFAAGNNIALTTNTENDTITISAVDTTYSNGSGLDLNGKVFSHSDTSNATNLTKTARTYIDGLTFDDYGHVTGYTTGTEIVTDTNTVTTITNNNKSSVGTDETNSDYIVLTDSGSNGNHEYKLFLNTTKIKELVAADVTAAMVFKGTATQLPETSEQGDIYKITTDSLTVSATDDAEGKGFTAKKGDSIVCDANNKWYLIPSGDDIEDTWRPIYIENPVSGSTINNEVSFTSSEIITVASSNKDYDHGSYTEISFEHAKKKSGLTDLSETNRTYVSGLTFDDYGHVTGYDTSTETIELKDVYGKVTSDTGSITADTECDEFKISGDSSFIETSAGNDVVEISHKTIHNEAGSITGTTSTTSVSHGSTVSIPVFNYDIAGHITSASQTSFKLPVDNAVVINETPDSKALIVESSTSEPDTNGNTTTTYNIYHKQYEGKNFEVVTSDTTLSDGETFKVISKLQTEEGHITAFETKDITLEETNSYGAINVANSTATTDITARNGEVRSSKPGSLFNINSGNKWVSLAASNSDENDTTDSVTIAHKLSGITAGTFTPSLTDNALKVYETVVDAAGHITSLTAKTLNITNTTYTLDSLSEIDLPDDTVDYIENVYDRISIQLKGSDNSTSTEHIVTKGSIRVDITAGTIPDMGQVENCLSLATTDELTQTDRVLGISKVNVRKLEQAKDTSGNVVDDDILIFNCGNATGW